MKISLFLRQNIRNELTNLSEGSYNLNMEHQKVLRQLRNLIKIEGKRHANLPKWQGIITFKGYDKHAKVVLNSKVIWMLDYNFRLFNFFQYTIHIKGRC